VDTVDAIDLVKRAAQRVGVQVVVLFATAKELTLVDKRFDVGLELRDFLLFKAGEDNGYRVPKGVLILARMVCDSDHPESFFAFLEEA
jgi:hypothetical protein